LGKKYKTMLSKMLKSAFTILQQLSTGNLSKEGNDELTMCSEGQHPVHSKL